VTVRPERWLRPPDADPRAALRLVMLPYSGAGAPVYHEWVSLLPSDVACQRIQLPGRLDRHDEPLLESVEAVVGSLVRVLDSTLDDRPYALFGHSMGALVAYRLAVALRQAAGPALLAVSGWAPRAGVASLRGLADQPDGVLIDAMRGLGTLPSGAATPELAALAVPAFRADLRVCAGYVDDEATVDCPVVAFAGRDDPLFPPASLRVWRDRTPSFLGVRVLPGDHMFVHRHAVSLATELVDLLRGYGGAD
jgi:surfactin synthase thioesterase subunit